MPPPAVFVDKDGTLVPNVPYNVDPEAIRLAPGAGELSRLIDLGFRIVVVSNQSGVARGHFDERALKSVERRLRDLLAGERVALAGFYYCPHHPDGLVGDYARECDCRKPRPGLLEAAARDLGLDLQSSWMIGDILDDVEAGNRAGCRTVLIDNGNETEWDRSQLRTPDHVVSGLADAAAVIAAAAASERVQI